MQFKVEVTDVKAGTKLTEFYARNITKALNSALAEKTLHHVPVVVRVYDDGVLVITLHDAVVMPKAKIKSYFKKQLKIVESSAASFEYVLDLYNHAVKDFDKEVGGLKFKDNSRTETVNAIARMLRTTCQLQETILTMINSLSEQEN